MKIRNRLRVATQKSGRLSGPGRELLSRAGLRFQEGPDRLFCFGENQPVDLLLVRDDDIPGLIAQGTCDLGFVGRNLLEEARLAVLAEGGVPSVAELRPLGFGACRLSIGWPQEQPWEGPRSLEGLRIATSYPCLLSDWLARNGVRAEVVTLSGSVEIAPRLGTAEAICDLVSSGATLAANQLREVAVVMYSEAVLAGPAAGFSGTRAELAGQLLQRMDGVLQGRNARLLMLQTSRSRLEQVRARLPEGVSPTISPVEGSEHHLSIQALCHGAISWQQLEALKQAGARSMLVLPVEQMLL